MGKYRKAIVAALGAGLLCAQGILESNDVANWESWQIVLAGLITTALVYRVPNKPPVSDNRVTDSRSWE